MTLDEFFERLPKDGWMLAGHHLRMKNGFCCPITACDPLRPGAGQWLTVYRQLGLSLKLAADIVDASDKHESSGYDPALRARLLQHCGLTEQP